MSEELNAFLLKDNEQLKSINTELIKANQKLHKKVNAQFPAQREEWKNCICEKPKTVINRSGPQGKDLCLDCAGWK